MGLPAAGREFGFWNQNQDSGSRIQDSSNAKLWYRIDLIKNLFIDIYSLIL
jgi:hypothetical protein